jgi:hypothetical protein
MAPNTPMIMVKAASPRMKLWVKAISCTNSSVKVRMRAYTPTFVSKPSKMADTAVSGSEYESGNQKNSGKIAAFTPKTKRNSIDSVVISPGCSVCAIFRARSAIFKVLVTLYKIPTKATNTVKAKRLSTRYLKDSCSWPASPPRDNNT